jgi:hypothetical protein
MIESFIAVTIWSEARGPVAGRLLAAGDGDDAPNQNERENAAHGEGNDKAEQGHYYLLVGTAVFPRAVFNIQYSMGSCTPQRGCQNSPHGALWAPAADTRRGPPGEPR